MGVVTKEGFVADIKLSETEIIDIIAVGITSPSLWKKLAIWRNYVPRNASADIRTIQDRLNNMIRRALVEPVNTSGNHWIYKDNYYTVKGKYSHEQFQLLILEEFDKERRLFEKLKQKFSLDNSESTTNRPRIPEHTRIEVWRRDGGKCARCGSRERLEYDHIVPISRGGSNTARNIELLCEACNRSKGANVT